MILCQITGQATKDSYTIEISANDFSSGSLNQISCVRPNRLFTADKQIVLYKISQISSQKMNEIITKVVNILES